MLVRANARGRGEARRGLIVVINKAGVRGEVVGMQREREHERSRYQVGGKWWRVTGEFGQGWELGRLRLEMNMAGSKRHHHSQPAFQLIRRSVPR